MVKSKKYYDELNLQRRSKHYTKNLSKQSANQFVKANTIDNSQIQRILQENEELKKELVGIKMLGSIGVEMDGEDIQEELEALRRKYITEKAEKEKIVKELTILKKSGGLEFSTASKDSTGYLQEKLKLQKAQYEAIIADLKSKHAKETHSMNSTSKSISNGSSSQHPNVAELTNKLKALTEKCTSQELLIEQLKVEKESIENGMDPRHLVDGKVGEEEE